MNVDLGFVSFDLTTWVIIGFVGQFFFSMRFIIQWLASEKVRKSIVPTAFWYFSLLGGMTLLAYALHKQDPVFILGQGLGVFIYLRNIYFLVRERKSVEEIPNPQN
ncbi:MAG: lipid-A-disaccharide synthase N-terminal domain-containing protein [Alphaproteobacteria bacterium]|nr:lipid-A-disaccharide synthase N-terminal domain-containing protein [Alphaproteobacteria bacterium]